VPAGNQKEDLILPVSKRTHYPQLWVFRPQATEDSASELKTGRATENASQDHDNDYNDDECYLRPAGYQ